VRTLLANLDHRPPKDSYIPVLPATGSSSSKAGVLCLRPLHVLRRRQQWLLGRVGQGGIQTLGRAAAGEARRTAPASMSKSTASPCSIGNGRPDIKAAYDQRSYAPMVGQIGDAYPLSSASPNGVSTLMPR
jgi:hypothetical protein